MRKTKEEKFGRIEEKDKNLGIVMPFDMYFNPELARLFATYQEHDQHKRISDVVDRVCMSEMAHLNDPLHVADLGAGAHPDRYDRLFSRLEKDPAGQFDWVDSSRIQLALAQEYLLDTRYTGRLSTIRWIWKDFHDYIRLSPDNSLHLVVLKNTLGYVEDPYILFRFLRNRLVPGGRVVATMGDLERKLPDHTYYARYDVNGRWVPKGGTTDLSEGDYVGVHFLRVPGNVDSGLLPGAYTRLYYHDPQNLHNVAQRCRLGCFMGSWKEVVSPELREGEDLDLNVLVLRKE